MVKKLILLTSTIIIAIAIQAQTVYPDFWDGVMYFKFKNEANVQLPSYSSEMDPYETFVRFPEFAELAMEFEITELVCPFKTQTIDIQNIYRIRFAAIERIDDLLKAVANMEFVEYAEKNPILRLFVSPDDPQISSQYYLTNIKAYDAWDLTTGDPNIKIAVVDDAIRVTHEDLAANIWVNPGEIADNGIDDDGNGFIDDVGGWDAADDDNDPNAPLTPPAIWGEMAFTHGTHCSGLAAGVTNNSLGIASVSYNVSLIPVKAVSDNSWFPLGIEAPEEGVDYAIAAGAHIVSMSFGGEQASGFATLETLINTGYNQGMLFVAAAGNNGDGSGGFGTTNAINYPAGFTNVIAVGATNSDDVKPGFSQYGTWLDVMAPGVGIYSTLAWSTPYGNQDGTSMACPIVAGALGLMKSYMPHATNEQLKFCLKEGCDDIDALNPTFAGEMGSGRINVYESLLCLNQYQSIYFSDDNQISLFPNPAQDNLRIGFNHVAQRNISIIDVNGKIVLSFSNNGAVAEINVSEFASGVYVCKIEENGLLSTHKFIISK